MFVQISFAMEGKDEAKICVENENVAGMIQKWYLGGASYILSYYIIFLCRLVDSFTRILHLSGYPQGWDMFTSPSVCKLYVDANGIRVMPRIGYGFLCKQYKSSKTPFNMGSSGILDSRSPIFRYNQTTQVQCGNSLSPHLSYYPSRKVD